MLKYTRFLNRGDNVRFKIYSDEAILYKLKDYFVYKFNLEENKNDIMVFCNKDFWFTARKNSTMDKIDTINITEILKSCNSIDSDDDIFYSEEDLLEELNSLAGNGDIVQYMKTFLEEAYGAMCVME